MALTAWLGAPSHGSSPEPLLEVTGLRKAYGAVQALRGASLSIRPGEVHALMGANGAGKSTLVKVLTGVTRPDAGRILIRGRESVVRSPADARRSGLVPVYQEPALLPDLEIRANLRLSQTPLEAFLERMSALGVPDVDPYALASDLPLAILRVMDLARAMAAAPDVLLLDEMTAALPADLAQSVLAEVGRYRETGRSVIFISHRLLEISALCDRATVLRDGETVGVLDVGPGTEHRIVELMLGPVQEDLERDEGRVAEREPAQRTEDATRGAVDRHADGRQSTSGQRLQVRGLGSGTKLVDVSFELRRGEVLGVVALEGQGQDELFGILSGALRPASGSIVVDEEEVRFGHPADAIARGMVYVPGDRAQGLLMQRSVRENIALPSVAPPRAWGPIDMGAESRKVAAAIDRLRIDTRAQGEVRRLSGGNQQKVTIARWVAGTADILLCFDPTRGIDIGTKRQIYVLLRELAENGASILLYTSELDEVRLACDRVIVIFGGRVVTEMPAHDADEATLLRWAHGLGQEETVAGSPFEPASDAAR